MSEWVDWVDLSGWAEWVQGCRGAARWNSLASTNSGLTKNVNSVKILKIRCKLLFANYKN